MIKESYDYLIYRVYIYVFILENHMVITKNLIKIHFFVDYNVRIISNEDVIMDGKKLDDGVRNHEDNEKELCIHRDQMDQNFDSFQELNSINIGWKKEHTIIIIIIIILQKNNENNNKKI